MRTAVVIGTILVVLGVLMPAYQGFTSTSGKRVADLGPIQATAKDQKTVDLPPVRGATAVIGGVALLVLGARKR
jgi:hypothetical protein